MPCRSGLPRLGRYGDTIRRVGMGLLHRWDALATPWSVSWLASCTRVQVSAARDALRYHAVGVQVVRGQVRAGMPTVGSLRRYHGQWEDNRLAYGCRTVPLGTLCDTIRWAWFGPGCQRLGRFGDSKRHHGA